MANYESQITRDNALALTPEKAIVTEIIQDVVKTSKVLPAMRRLPDMSTKTETMAILDSLPKAYWVDGDTGFKQTTNAMWKNKKIVAEELAVIVPISKNVLRDASYDIIGQVKPRIVEAMQALIDEAILTGANKPAGFPNGLLTEITTKGKTVTSTDNLFDDISDAMSKVELSGFNPTSLLAGVEMKGKIRKELRDTTGNPLASSEVTDLPRYFVDNGSWDKSKALAIVGDFKQAVFAFRQDFEFEVFDTGVISDPSSHEIIYNLLQQDMVALRVTFRLGWQVPNPVTLLDETETRYPFAAIVEE